MNKDVLEAQVRAVLPVDGSFAVFIGCADKTFVIYVEESVGSAIAMFMRGQQKQRPLTHELIGHLMMAFGAKVERVVINHLDAGVFYARLILVAENELHHRKVVEIDARPSDSIALATQAGAPILVARSVWEQVDDVSETLAKIEAQGLFQGADANADEESSLDDEEDEDDDDDDLDDLDDDLFDDDLEDDEDDEDDLEDDDDEEDSDADDDPFKFGLDDDEGEGWKKGDN